jgi:hypothetical protein
VKQNVDRRIIEHWRLHKCEFVATSSSGDEFTFVKFLFIPHQRVYKFGPAEGALTHNQDDLYFLLLCYDAFCVLIADNIAYLKLFSEMTYKDP